MNKLYQVVIISWFICLFHGSLAFGQLDAVFRGKTFLQFDATNVSEFKNNLTFDMAKKLITQMTDPRAFAPNQSKRPFNFIEVEWVKTLPNNAAIEVIPSVLSGADNTHRSIRVLVTEKGFKDTFTLLEVVNYLNWGSGMNTYAWMETVVNQALGSFRAEEVLRMRRRDTLRMMEDIKFSDMIEAINPLQMKEETFRNYLLNEKARVNKSIVTWQKQVVLDEFKKLGCNETDLTHIFKRIETEQSSILEEWNKWMAKTSLYKDRYALTQYLNYAGTKREKELALDVVTQAKSKLKEMGFEETPDLNRLVSQGKRQEVAKLVELYLPWELMEPYEEMRWRDWVDSIRNPSKIEDRVLLFRGMADEFVKHTDDEKSFWIWSTLIGKSQNSYNQRLSGLKNIFLGEGKKDIRLTMEKNNKFGMASGFSTMFENHSGAPFGSPFLSFSESPKIASRFTRDRTYAHDRFGVFAIDPRRFLFNHTTRFASEREMLLPLFTFPDESLALLLDKPSDVYDLVEDYQNNKELGKWVESWLRNTGHYQESEIAPLAKKWLENTKQMTLATADLPKDLSQAYLDLLQPTDISVENQLKSFSFKAKAHRMFQDSLIDALIRRSCDHWFVRMK